MRGVGALLVTALAAAAVAGLVRDAAGSDRAVTTAVPSETVLRKRLEVLFGNPLAGVQHEIGGGQYGARAERWIDLGPGDRKQRYSLPRRHVLHGAGGKVLYEYTSIVERPDTLRCDVLDYAKHTWTTYRRHFTPMPTRPLPPEVAVGPLGMAVGFVRRLTMGPYEVVGHETIGGRKALQLRSTTSSGRTFEVWIDASTYLVLRQVDAAGSIDYDYLRRTPGNVAKTRLTVPRGFRHRTSGAPPPEPNF